MLLYLPLQQGMFKWGVFLWTVYIRVLTLTTTSGKSLIYQIPVLQSLLKDKNSKAMYIFPTKALAQDQKRALEAIMHRIPNLEQIMVLGISVKKKKR